VADAAKSAAGDAFQSIAHDFAKAADSATNWLWSQLGSATAVHLGGTGFTLDVGIVLAITATVAVGLFVIQLIVSTLKRDSGGIGRALRGLVIAFVGGGVAIAVTNLLLAAIDSLSAGVAKAATGDSLSQMGHSIMAAGAVSASTSNPALMIVLSIASLGAVGIVWVALMLRKVLIVVSAVFAPLAFAGSLADLTVSWTRRWIEAMVALIVSKLVLVIIFVIGLGMLVDGVGQSGSGTSQIATQTVSGLLVLALAGFAPWFALKLVHWSGDQFLHVHSLGTAATAGAKQAVRAPQKVQSMAMAGFGGGAGVGAAAVGAGAGAGGIRQIGGWGSNGSMNPTGTARPGQGGPTGTPTGTANGNARPGDGPGLGGAGRGGPGNGGLSSGGWGNDAPRKDVAPMPPPPRPLPPETPPSRGTTNE